jgi:hypothetical protein
MLIKDYIVIASTSSMSGDSYLCSVATWQIALDSMWRASPPMSSGSGSNRSESMRTFQKALQERGRRRCSRRNLQLARPGGVWVPPASECRM